MVEGLLEAKDGDRAKGRVVELANCGMTGAEVLRVDIETFT